MKREPSLYGVLGVSETATRGEIKQAYHRRARKYHSDTAASGEADDARFAKLTEAYETLSDPESQREYDEGLMRDTRGAQVSGEHPRHSDESPVGRASEPVDPQEHVAEEPLLPALAKLLWRLIRAGARALPTVIRRGPRAVLVVAGLVLAVFISSWAIRSYSKFADEGHFKNTLPDSLTSHCRGRSGIGEHLPRGSSAALDCNVRGVHVTYFDTEDDYAGRYFARHLRQAKKQATLRKDRAGSCARPGHITAYRYRGRGEYGSNGRVFCWIDEQGKARFEWAEEDTYAQALSDRSYRRMYRWWRKQAGPDGGLVNSGVVGKVR